MLISNTLVAAVRPRLGWRLQAGHNVARLVAGAAVWGLLCGAVTQAEAQNVGFFTDTTYKIVQLTGETDQPRRIPTLSRMGSSYCVGGTDLGSTFEHNGHLYFLFGDTPNLPGTHDDRDDFLAWTDATRPEDVTLNVNKDGGCVHILTVPGVVLSGLEVPSYGISLASGIYAVVTTDASFNPDTMGRSVMAVSHDDGYSFQQLYDLSVLSQGGKFINVSMVEVDGRQYSNLPLEPCVMIWGSGRYRQSDVLLAYVPSSQITNQSAIRYLSSTVGPEPFWSSSEADAVSLFNPSEPVVGELSVAYCQPLAQWLMLYNAGAEIHMRSASLPWGPWSSQPTTIFEGTRDRANSRYIHEANGDVFSDTETIGSDAGGGPYGPYLIPLFFQGDQNRVSVVYTMSTWNPYQALLMQSDIGYPDQVHETTSSLTTLPGDPDWIVSGNFLTKFTFNGVPYVTTYSANGDADMGVAQYGFFASGCDQALQFSVHGGDAEVVLIEQSQDVPAAVPDVPTFYTALKTGNYGRVVETIIGPQSNSSDHELSVRWDLRRHRGKMMRLFVIDWLNRPWGFISVSQITRFFVNGSAAANIYVNGANGIPPFLGTPANPFQTVTAGYNAAATAICPANLLIQTGHYLESLTMNRPVMIQSVGGEVSIGH
jgi:hypothetical protein